MGVAPSAAAGTGQHWPLVGRDDELKLAASTVAAGGSVVLTGSAGVGKTRLAHEVLAAAAAAGARTEWARATQAAATVPLGAVAHLLPGVNVGRTRSATLRAIVAALERERAGARLVLGVDDAHLLDDASAVLVQLLVTSGTASVVATARSGERQPDPIVALWKDGPAPLIALQPLARTEVERLVTTALDGLLDGVALHHLWESTRGNALFLRELVRGGLESGALWCERGLWRWRGPLQPAERLRDVVALRTGQLEDAERSALELLAIGEPLPLACLHRLGASKAIERLERRGLATTRAEDREVRLAHPLFGEVVRADIPVATLDAVRLQLADAVEATADLTLNDVLRVALWRADAGDTSRPDQLRVGARRAWVLGDARVAERLARAALMAGPEIEAGYLLGEALSDQGRAREALDAWSAAAELPGPDAVKVSIAVASAGVYAYQLDQPEQSAEVIRRAAGQLRDDAARRRLDGSVALFRAAHPLASGVLPDGMELPAPAAPSSFVAMAIEATRAGRLDLALSTIDETMGRADEFAEEQPTIVELLRMLRVQVLALLGRAHEAGADAHRGYEETVRDNAELSRARWCVVLGMVGVLRGHPAGAIRPLREAVPLLEAAEMGWRRPTFAYLAMARALQGDVTAADVALDGAGGSSRALERVFGIDVARARAWIHAARGETTAAALIAEAAAMEAAEGEQWAYEALACHDVVRFGRVATVVDRLGELAKLIDGTLVDGIAEHARAVAANDGAALDRVSATFAELGFDLFGAEASATAAAAHRQAGRKASAIASTDRARELAERCAGVRTPALAWLEQPDDLTTREREVADLAAAEMSSRAIGERLGITTRTVDNLLGRVYAKLGVSGRQELVSVLGHHDPAARPRE